jgi:hypothetical protein
MRYSQATRQRESMEVKGNAATIKEKRHRGKK